MADAKGWETDTTTARAPEPFGYAYDTAWNFKRRTKPAPVQTVGANNSIEPSVNREFRSSRSDYGGGTAMHAEKELMPPPLGYRVTAVCLAFGFCDVALPC